MNNDLVTAIVPVYNVEKYINKCVASLLNQSYRNIDIILVDDGSTDNSGNICNEIANKESRVTVIHKKNGGLSDARNIGLANVKGKYITFVDSDDYVDEKYIEVLYTNTQKNYAEISISDFLKFYGDEALDVSSIDESVDSIVMNQQQGLAALFDDQYKYQFTMACGKLFKTSLLEGFAFPVGRNYEDSATAHLLISKADTIVYTNRKQYFYRTRKTSITKSDKFLKDDVIVAMKDRVDWFEKNGYLDLFRKAQVQYVLCMMGVYARLTSSKAALITKNKLHEKIAQYLRQYREVKHVDRRAFFKIELFLFSPSIYSAIVRNKELFKRRE